MYEEQLSDDEVRNIFRNKDYQLHLNSAPLSDINYYIKFVGAGNVQKTKSKR